MKSKLFGGALALSCLVQAHAATLNIPFQAGDHEYGPRVLSEGTSGATYCRATNQGGVRRNEHYPTWLPQGSPWCATDIVLPIESGRTIKQVSILHGSDGPNVLGSTDGIEAYLGQRLFRASPVNDNFENDWLHVWSSDVYVVDSGMAIDNLMAQQGTTYPDAFVVGASNAYFVRVIVSGDAEFFGLRVIYD